MSEYLRMSNLEIKGQINSAVDDRRREEEQKQEREEERGEKMLGRLEKKKERNRKNKFGSQKRGEDRWVPEVPLEFDSEFVAQLDKMIIGQGKEKKQERGEESGEKMLGRLGKKKKRSRKNKCGRQKKGEDRWFPKIPPVFDPEIKAKAIIDKLFNPEIKAKGNIDKVPVDGQGYHIRGRRGDHIYIRRTLGAGCSWTGESPPKVVSTFVLYGAKFLSKTIKMAPDGCHSTLNRYCVDETKIIVKGKDSVCGVSRRNYQEGRLEATTFASAAHFCFGEKHGFPRDSDDYEEMMKPFSHVTFCLDTSVKEGCKDNEYIESKGCEDYLIEKNIEPLCDEDLAAHFNEQKAINYLESKMKQDPVIGHDETIQTAITAFNYLFRDGLKSDEIKVYVVGKGFWIEKTLSVEEIEACLAP